MKGNQLASTSLRAGLFTPILLLGILGAGFSMISVVLYLLAAVSAIVAIVTGHVAWAQMHRTKATNSRQASIGLVLGYSLLLLMLVGALWLFSAYPAGV